MKRLFCQAQVTPTFAFKRGQQTDFTFNGTRVSIVLYSATSKVVIFFLDHLAQHHQFIFDLKRVTVMFTAVYMQRTPMKLVF